VAPTGLIALASVIVVGSTVAVGVVTDRHPSASAAPAASSGSGQPVLVVTGFNSTWDGGAGGHFDDRFSEWRYSYRGTGADGRPLPYDAGDTHRSLAELARTMRDQVSALHRATGRRVDLVAESEGSVVTTLYLVANPEAPVDSVILLSPVVRPARVYYPARGDDGWGMAAGWALRGMSSALGALSRLDLSADSPFLRSILDHGPAVRGIAACDPVHVREVVLFPIADAVAAPPPHARVPGTRVVPAFHGGLLGDGAVERTITRALLRQSIAGRTGPLHLAERLIRAGASAWQVPELPVGINQRWAGAEPVNCAEVRSAVQEWMEAEPVALP
jgi:hypothetical protein